MGETPVYVTTYDVVGEGFAIAQAYYAEIEKANIQRFDIANSLGGIGFRPGYYGGIQSIFFKAGALPEGFREIGKEDGNIEALPHKGKADGRDAAKAMADAPKGPLESRLASEKFGWNNDFGAIYQGRIYHATAMRLLKPVERFFVRLPRQPDDGYEAPPTLREIPESEFMRAVEAHNAVARAQAEGKAA